MKQAIIAFDQDEKGDWRAALACGHYQHFRHDPPLTNREWVITETGRGERTGVPVECKKCDDGVPPDRNDLD